MDVIEIIKDSLSMVDLIDRVGGAEIKKNGSGYVGWHKAHGSQSKSSLWIDPHLNLWHCFNCGQGGDQLTWLGHLRNGNAYRDDDPDMFKEVLAESAALAGIELDNQVDRAELAERRRLTEIFGVVADYYHAQLTDAHRAHLAKRYGLTDETVDQLQIGYAHVGGMNLVRFLKAQGITDDEVLASGLVRKHTSRGVTDLFQGRIIFPYWKQGHPVYFIGRQTDASPQ